MFFVLALLSVLGRIVVRVYTRRRLFLDDAFLVWGLVCLCAAKVLSLRMLRTMFLVDAIQHYSDIVIPTDQARPLLRAMAVGAAYLGLTWTTMFAVKFSFLALYWHLIQRVSQWLIRYYWAVVGTCIVSWMFVICEPFLLCHYFGINTCQASFSPPRVEPLLLNVWPVKCLSNVPYRLNAGLTGLITALDIITDIMSKSEPAIQTHDGR